MITFDAADIESALRAAHPEIGDKPLRWKWTPRAKQIIHKNRNGVKLGIEVVVVVPELPPQS